MIAFPRGFKTNASGLLVPEELSRERKVCAKDDLRKIDRATKLLAGISVLFQFTCPDPRCRQTPIERLRRIDGGITLRCNHLDREFTKF